ncbi:MAG: hypothetical protein ACR2RV_15580, partial [Verrucomicrobiales bacterium]
MASWFVFSASALDSRADHDLDRLELQFSIGQEKLQQPLVQLRDGYSKRLGQLREEFGAAGNLEGVLAAKAAAKAGEPKADQISEVPKLAQLQNLFLTEQAKRLEKQADSLLSLRRTYVKQLGALHEKLANGGDAASAKAVLDKINQLEKAILAAKPPPEKKIDFVEDLEMTGRFYSFVNATASFYVNGKRVHSARKGKSTSAPCEVKVGDCVVFSLHNGDGGRKRFKTSFMSDDKAYVISFAANDLKVIPDGDRRRSVTGLEFDRMTVFANTR